MFEHDNYMQDWNTPVEQKPLAIVCDLDGTLCINDQGRNPFEYREARHDAVNAPVAEALRVFTEGDAGIDILFVSAREKYGYYTVENWIKHHLPFLLFKPLRLFMRKNKDFRKDAVVKEEIYLNDVKPYYDVLFVLDDRDQVVNMWREKLRLTCFQVAKGAF